MDGDTLFFFRDQLEVLGIYEELEGKILERWPQVDIKVKKTQITFSLGRGFAYVSFLPVLRAKDRPRHSITVSFGLDRREEHPRIHGAVEPYPGRWTHHVMVGSREEIDDMLMDWISQAAAFAERKR